MKIRTFVTLLLALALIFAITLLFEPNVDTLRQSLQLWGGTTITVGWALAWCFVAGMILIFAFGLSREFARTVEH